MKSFVKSNNSSGDSNINLVHIKNSEIEYLSGKMGQDREIFDEKELETVERVGKPNGLILALNLNHELSKEFLIVNPNIGITIKIDDNLYNSEFKGAHKEKDVIYNDIDLIDILPGVVTNIVIEKVISKKLPKPYSSYEIEDGKFEIIK